ncbi:vWA domain-containing protein [Marinomonas sp. PE14-40]|uniref:vWA domain-containing protein n=1 Tax=Marinomonas sp. PE14-40 TaxID=3060621 RepID=UPI003F666C3E
MLLRVIMAICLLGTSISTYASTQFRVIVDASGSMVISDPDRLTSESLRLIADLAPEEESSLGVWLFGEEPRVLLPETPITEELKTSLKNNLGGYVTEDLQTDLESVLRLMLDTPAAEGVATDSEQHWILVTDGMVDISLDQSVNALSRQNILTPILDELIEKGIHLHTVSMTGYTDSELLKTLSVKTDASHTEVAVPEDLLSTFNRIFTSANKADELPFEGNTFFIDDSIDEFTLLVFHKLGKKPKVIAPKGDVLTLKSDQKVTVANGLRYTLVTVEEPMLGTWQVEDVDLEKSSIRIVTNLKVEASNIASVLFVNEPLFSSIGLYENGELIQDPILLEVLKAEQSLIRHRGEILEVLDNKELSQSSYQFKNKFDSLMLEGDYELRSFLDGQSFARKLSQYFTVTPAISLSVKQEDYGLMSFSVKPSNLRLDLFRSQAFLEVEYDNATRVEEELPLIGAGFWQKLVPSKKVNFTARVKLKGVTQTGVRFDYTTNPLNFAYNKPVSSNLLTDVAPGTAVTDFIAESREGFSGIESQVEESLEEKLKIEIDATDLMKDMKASIDDVANSADALISGDKVEKENSADVSFSSGEILVYALINITVFLLIGGGIWWLRRRSKANKTDLEESV